MMCCCTGEDQGSVSKTTELTHSASASGRTAKAGSGEKRPRTIQDDPESTEVFKSLFNTHRTAKQQQQAHWVTYNPQYF